MSSPSTSELFRVFGRIGLLSFGGPAAQIALMHKELVEDRPWLSERQFLSALSFCMLLPGPEAMQLATYAGWLKRGTLGGVIAGTLFVLPGAAVVLALALAYAQFGSLPLVQAAFLGVQATVVVIVLMALKKIADKALNNTLARVLALTSFLAIFALNAPFPLVVLGAAAIGALWPDATSSGDSAPPRHPFNWHAVLTCIALWALPFAALMLWPAPFLWDVAQFFSTLAVVTFGGAYAVLAYMTQAVVQDFNWLSVNQMMDALGLAETTPGPLILVTQFVAMLAGQLQGGLTTALMAGALTLWVTFVPCFLWIFAAAPYVERITHAPRLSGALSAITAAVAGVIANLSIWFAMQLLFAEVTQTPFAPLPVWSSLSPIAAIFIALAAVLMLVLKRSMMTTLALMATAGVFWGLLGA
ncbi:chromate efflux transporter [Thalassovita mediterranea]|jgi:chromate transporter|uniref:Putative chromate transport protein n=1 Tax=Thalassovita mediterranea TaxID=340021 RepID=A0A0P1H0P1_9RHOB|nr:chromate efflux transporter [Thalassovita mediterranea]CUH83342.1 putative chromate transport protein [Thalassovita mediterranea]SIS34028.1 chromate transporter [Thalassovita mediterranea]